MPPQNSLNITQPIQPPNMHPQASSNNGKLTISNLNPQQQNLITHTDPQNPRNSLKNDTNQHHANPPTPTNNNMSMSGGSIVNDNLLQQLEMKSSSQIPHHVPIQSMGGKPSVMGLMPNYEDPVEQSLASLEQQPMHKNEIDGMQNHMDLMNDMSSIISKQEGGPTMQSHQSLMLPHLGYDSMQQHNHGGNNGFGIDSPLTMNGMNMGAMVGVGNHLPMLGMPPMGLNSLPQPNPPTSIFDPLPQGVHRSNSSSVTSMSITQSSAVTIRKEEKFMLTPKPIEELMNPSHDKKTSPIDGKSGAGFVHAINKLDHNLKNASSWSSLAAAGSPQNPLSSKSKPPAMDSFQQFRNKAKEKADRQKMLEQQELRRTQKEAAEKRNQEQQKHTKQRDEVEVPAR